MPVAVGRCCTAFFVAILMLASAGAARAQGLTFFVDSAGDGGNRGGSGVCDDGTGHCTLRAAIQAANSTAGSNGIRFSLPAGAVIQLGQTLPDITESVSIIGPGAGNLTVRRNTGGNYRVIALATTGAVGFSGLTISNGLFNGDGGAIYKPGSGTLNVTGCTFVGNIAVHGGAIYAGFGTLNVTDSTFAGNGANLDGGAIAIFVGTVNVLRSTFTANIANEAGAGIFRVGGGGAIVVGDAAAASGFLNVTQSTFVANTAFNGGALSIHQQSIARLTNNTIVGNSGFFAGGIHVNVSAGVFAESNLIATNGGSNSAPDVRGPIFFSGGYNLVGKTDSSTGFTAPTDQTGTIASPLDPRIDPAGLQYNGGPTQTVALLPDSPAVDKGTSDGLAGHLLTDQRGPGFRRTNDSSSIPNALDGDGTDIGAFETAAIEIPVLPGALSDLLFLALGATLLRPRG